MEVKRTGLVARGVVAASTGVSGGARGGLRLGVALGRAHGGLIDRLHGRLRGVILGIVACRGGLGHVQTARDHPSEGSQSRVFIPRSSNRFWEALSVWDSTMDDAVVKNCGRRRQQQDSGN